MFEPKKIFGPENILRMVTIIPLSAAPNPGVGPPTLHQLFGQSREGLKKLNLCSFQTWAVFKPGQLSHWGSCHPGAVVYLGSCPTWAVVQPGQLSYLGSCLPGQLLPGQLSAWAVVAWAVVLAPF